MISISHTPGTVPGFLSEARSGIQEAEAKERDSLAQIGRLRENC